MFVLGVGALAAVVLTRPLWATSDASSPLKRDLAEARRLLERPDGDAEQAAKLAQQVLEAKDQHPEAAGEADMLLGTARMQQAAAADGAHAAELWADARRHLEAAEHETVPEKDGPLLQFRLGIVGFHTHDDPDRVISRIKTAIDKADDQVLGYTVLTQAYLNRDKPDLQEALAANLKLRNLPQAKEEVLAPARLQAGELHLRLGQPEQARRVLKNIGAQAAPEIQAKARRLIARSFQEQNPPHWAEAAAAWQEAMGDGKQPGEALYNLGLCALRQDQSADAAQFWEKCVQGGGDEGQAAALALAEMRLNGRNPESALEMLTLVVDKVKPGDVWTNPLLEKTAVVKLFQDAGKAYLDNRQFDAAMRLAAPFALVATPPEADVLRAKASAEWARARAAEATTAATAEASQAAKADAQQLFLQAAAAYAVAAEQAPTLPVPGEYLWLSARCSWEARDLDQAGARLEQVIHLPLTDDQMKEEWCVERLGEAYFLLGEVRRAQNDSEAANAAYRLCISKQTNFAYRARYYLALSAAAAGQIDQALDTLEQNLTLLRQNPDAEAQQMTLYLLGDLLYKKGNYHQVVQRLGEALSPDRFPANKEATRAHFQLADSYRRLADEANVEALSDGSQSKEKREQKLKEHNIYLTNAADEFLDLAALLDKPAGRDLLTLEERVQVPFLAADCLFDMGQYKHALMVYEAQAKRYTGRLEGLNALGGMVRCYAALEDKAKMQQCLAEIDSLLPKMPRQVQEQWSEWLRTARKPIATP
jgi:hypothetical protein